MIGRNARRQVQIRCVVLDSESEQLRNIYRGHSDSFRTGLSPREKGYRS